MISRTSYSTFSLSKRLALAAAAIPVAALCGGFFSVTASGTVDGQSRQRGEESKTRIVASLITEMESWRPGRTELLGVHMQIERGWHTYWNGLNDTGFPIELKITAPEGYKVEPTRWPVPRRYVSPGDILDHVYENEVTLLIPIVVPATAKPGEFARFEVEADWLVCKEACIPENAKLAIAIPIADPESTFSPTQRASAIKRAAELLPLPAKEFRGSTTWTENVVTIHIAGARSLEFYPRESGIEPVDALRECMSVGETLRFRVRGNGNRTQGVLRVEHADKSARYYELEISRAVQ